MGTNPSPENLTKTATWLVAARLFSYVLTIALPLLLVRKLDQHTFGLYKQMFLVVSTVTGLAPLGFAMNAYYFFPRHADRRPVVNNIVLYLGVTGLLVFLTAVAFPQTAVWMTGTPEAAQYASLTGLCTACMIVAYSLEILPIANGEARLAGVILLLIQISRLAFAFTAAILWGTVASQLWAILLHAVCQMALLAGYLLWKFPGFFRMFDWKLLGEQFTYTVRLVLPLFVLILQNDLHQYLVSRWYGPAEFAIYANGCLQIPIVLLLIEAVGPLLIRRISELRNQGDGRAIVRLTMTAARKLALVFFPTAAGLIVLGHEFIILLYTRQYLDSYPILAVNSLLIPLGVLMLDPISRAYPELQGVLMRNRLILLVVFSGCLWFLTSRLGPLGAIAAVVTVNVLERLVMGYYWLRIVLHGKRADMADTGDLIRIAIAAAAAGLITLLAKQSLMAEWQPGLILVLGGCLYACCYGLSLFILRVFSLADLSQGRQLLRF